jgi:hypothetical protein
MRVAQLNKPRPNKVKRQLEEDNNLPTNVVRYNDKKGSVGYKARRRKDGKIRQKSFVSTNYTMNENLEMAIKWQKTGESHKGRLNRARKSGNILPKYIQEVKNGYKVRLPSGSQFQVISKKFTMEEKLEKSEEFLKRELEKERGTTRVRESNGIWPLFTKGD